MFEEEWLQSGMTYIPGKSMYEYYNDYDVTRTIFPQLIPVEEIRSTSSLGTTVIAIDRNHQHSKYKSGFLVVGHIAFKSPYTNHIKFFSSLIISAETECCVEFGSISAMPDYGCVSFKCYTLKLEEFFAYLYSKISIYCEIDKFKIFYMARDVTNYNKGCKSTSNIRHFYNIDDYMCNHTEVEDFIDTRAIYERAERLFRAALSV